MKLNQESRKKLYEEVVKEIDKKKQSFDNNLTGKQQKVIAEKNTKLIKLVNEFNKNRKRNNEIEEIIKKAKGYNLYSPYHSNDDKGELRLSSEHPEIERRHNERSKVLDKFDTLKINTFAKIYEMEEDFSSILNWLDTQIKKF